MKPCAPVFLALLLLGGCGSAEAPPAPAAPAPIVRPVDLAVAKRNRGEAPANAAIIEISPTEIALEGRKLVDLAGGRIPEAALREGALFELVLPARTLEPRGVVIRMHANTRYDVMLQVLRSLTPETRVGFAVRAGMTPTMGLLTAERFEVRAPSDDPITFEPPRQHEWSEFVALWDEIHSRCEGEFSFQCQSKPERVAEGGKLEIALFTQQDAFVIDFRRFGTEDPPPPPVVQLPPQIGTRDEDRRVVREPPATRATFFWLRGATQQAESPMGLALRPLCQAQSCGVRVTAPPETYAGQVLIVIGAAFPDGFAPPHVVLETGSR